MDRDVAKQTKPGAAHELDDGPQAIGKGTLSGRLGGEHGAPDPAKPAPAPAPAAGPAAGKALTITSSTSAKAPAAGNTRTTVGVGEVVSFTGSEEGEWTTTGGKTLSDTKTTDFRWSAPGAPGSYTITLTVGDKKATKTIVVVAPTQINFTKVGTPALSAGQGAGMTLRMDLNPKTVSFGAIQVQEKAGGATGVWGYFANKQKSGADLKHVPKGNPTWVEENNVLDTPDDAYFDGWPAPWEPGGMTWLIPNLWSLIEGGGTPVPFATVTQTMHIADTKGTSVITKGGQTASRNASK